MDRRFFLVVRHADTPRALFNKDHVVRLLKLAGSEALAKNVELGTRKFYALPSEEAEPYVKRAREIIAERERSASTLAVAARMVARQYHVAAERALGDAP